MLVLAGDAGGTTTRLALFDVGGSALRLVTDERYSSREHAGLAEIVRRFVDERGAPERATLGVAGPVRDGSVRATNLPWDVDVREIAAAAGLQRASLLNDLEANAWGLRAVGTDDFVTLQEGAADARGNQALVSAGTGLGEAGLLWDGDAHRPFACEGGHSTFAPNGATETALMEHLALEHGHVSWERVLSGPGLVNVYTFLRHARSAATPSWLAEEMRAGDAAAAVSRAALDGRDETCSDALDLFAGLYGAEAGNLALKMMATGGVFIGGGIAPKILPRLRGPRFLAAFLGKGRMRPLLAAMPVRVVVDDRAALLGAAWHAAFAEAPHGD